jgi:copper chaperone
MGESMEQFEFEVGGMSCTGCEENVTNAAKQVDGVHRVEADHECGEVEITAEEGTEADVKQAIHDAGYDVPA